jgi:hypothetical protein
VKPEGIVSWPSPRRTERGGVSYNDVCPRLIAYLDLELSVVQEMVTTIRERLRCLFYRLEVQKGEANGRRQQGGATAK